MGPRAGSSGQPRLAEALIGRGTQPCVECRCMDANCGDVSRFGARLTKQRSTFPSSDPPASPLGADRQVLASDKVAPRHHVMSYDIYFLSRRDGAVLGRGWTRYRTPPRTTHRSLPDCSEPGSA